MKRIISFTLFIGLLIFFFQFVMIYISQGHEVEYSFQSEDYTYDITETLLVEDRVPTYQLAIQSEDNLFLFENKTDYNKQKKIISDIKRFTSGDIECLYPVYKDQLDDVHDPMCVMDHKQYSYTYLSSQNSSLLSFKDTLMKEGITLPSWKTLDAMTDYNGISIRQASMPENLYLAVWRYRGIVAFSKENARSTSLLSSDQYSSRGVLQDHYYVVPEYTQNSEFNNLLVTDVTLFGSREIKLSKPISKDCYFNGVVGDNIYLFDRTNLVQYEININTNTVREIGNKEVNAQYYDGSVWSDRNIYDFTQNKILFGKDYHKIEGISSYDFKEVFETENSYYFLDNGNRFYRLYKSHLDHPILLASFNSVSEMRMANDFALFLVDDTIYYYHEAYGLIPFISYNEFRYNPTDVFEIYYKK